MGQSRTKICRIRLALAFMAAAILALTWSPVALAQQDDQYGGTIAPSGPAAGEPATVEGDDDGVVGPGDVIIIPGDFVVSEGASVTLEDSDGTQGTLIDGQNANITEGSIVIEVTGEPVGVAGGNGVLNTDGLFVVATTGIYAADDGAGAGGAGAGDGVGAGAGEAAGPGSGQGAGAGGTGAGDAVADDAAASDAAAGDAVADDAADEEAPVGVSVLPDTGGSAMVFVLAGGLALLGAGFVIRRFAGNN